jgi:Putative viral replication protein
MSEPVGRNSFQGLLLSVKELIFTSKMPICARYVFTTNNYTQEEEQALVEAATSDLVQYLVYGREVGESGTPHLQGYVRFHKKIGMREIKALFKCNHVHLEHAKANDDKAIEYCKKDGNYEEFGKIEKKSGKRTDLDAFMDSVKNGEVNLKTLREEHPQVCAMYPRFTREYLQDQLVAPKVATYPLRKWQPVLGPFLFLVFST